MKSCLILVLVLFFQSSHGQQKNLEYYLNQGIQNSPLLKDYQNQQQINHLDSLRLRASKVFQVNAVSNNLYAPVINGWGYDEAITNGANISALVAASKEITWKRNLNSQFKVLQLDKQTLNLSIKLSENDLKKSITEQYLLSYGLWEQYSFNKDILSLFKQEELLINKLTEKGVYKQTDFLSFMVNLRQQELTLIQLKLQYQGNYTQLNALCGLSDTAFAALNDPELGLAFPAAVQNTPAYMQFAIDSLKLRTSDEQIDFAYQPKISLYADAGYVSSLALMPWKNFGASIGINASIPLYDGRQRKLQHDKITTSELTRQNYRSFYTQQYTQQINGLMQQLKSIELTEKQAQEQIKYSETLIEADQKLINTGDIQVTDYILAISNYLQAKNARIQLVISKYLIINQINYLNLKQ